MTILHSLLIAWFLSSHPMHVAYTNIEINSEKNNIAVSHKVFTADFSLLFYHLFEKTIKPDSGKDFDVHEMDLINQYMDQRFILICDTDTLHSDYVGKKMENESLWLNYNYTIKKENPLSLEIINLLMMDLYMDQTNLVIIRTGSNENGLSFNWDNRQSVISIKD